MSVGIWSNDFNWQPNGRVQEAAAEVEALGFDHLWVGEWSGREAISQAALLLAATRTITIATGVARYGRRDPVATAAAHLTLSEAYPGRFLLGLGGQLVGARPVQAIRDYLDAMDSASLFIPEPAASPRRVLAALGPKMLALAAERTDGAHPYLVPPEHTKQAREIMGAKAFLAVEQTVALDDDQEMARAWLGRYLANAPHYVANLRRLGFTEQDVSDGGSDRLVDALIAFGEQGIADRVRAHLDAGADHVCVQVITGAERIPLPEWRRLAPILL